MDIEIFCLKKTAPPTPIKEILMHKLVIVLNVHYFPIMELIKSLLHLGTGFLVSGSFGYWTLYVTTKYYEVISIPG